MLERIELGEIVRQAAEGAESGEAAICHEVVLHVGIGKRPRRRLSAWSAAPTAAA